MFLCIQGEGVVPSEFIELARTILLDLINSNEFGGFAGHWTKDRIQVSSFLSVVSVFPERCISIQKVPTKHDCGMRQPRQTTHNVRGNA